MRKAVLMHCGEAQHMRLHFSYPIYRGDNIVRVPLLNTVLRIDFQKTTNIPKLNYTKNGFS